MAKKSPQRAPKTETRVISFRIAPDLYAQLETHASKLKDEAGMPLNASGLARRLVIAGMPSLRKSDLK